MKSLLRKSATVYRGYHSLRLLRQRWKRDAYLRHEAELLAAQGHDLERLSRLALKNIAWEREIFSTNEVYSNDINLKRFLQVDPTKRFRCIIEHGLVLTRALVENHLTFPFATQNIVMSKARRDFLAANGIKSTAIGPYIHYATPLLGEQRRNELKTKLGKTLLFFPSHSTQDISLKESYRDLNSMLAETASKHGFDSVLVCGYFIDIENGLFDFIEKKTGYHFVSCGHRLGPAFLSLLKSYLLLADVVASNSVGTQTGYALFYGKPFWVIGAHDVRELFSGDVRSVALEKSATHQPLIGVYGLSYEEFEGMFRNETCSIDAGVFKCVKALWGFDDVLDRDELYRAIF